MGSVEMIEWDVVQPALRDRLVVERKVPSHGCDAYHRRGAATLDDLRKACEVVGLVVVTQDENTERATQAQQMATALAEVRSRLEQAEADTGIGLRALVATYVAACKDLGVKLGNLGLGVDRALGAEAERTTLESEVETLKLALEDCASRRDHANEQNTTLRAQLAAAAADQSEAEDRIATLEAKLAAADKLASSLVERLVASDVVAGFEVAKDVNGRLGVSRVTVRTRDPKRPSLGTYATHVTDLPAADVPATLARLAGLDGGR
jgi:hypothetical protein